MNSGQAYHLLPENFALFGDFVNFVKCLA